jgi:diguanylate cyclase (GGDEF)-like protein
MTRQLRSVDNALRAIRGDLRAAAESGAVQAPRRLQNLSDVMPGLKGFLATDEDGQVIAAERPVLLGQNFSRRDYFSVPREQPDFTTLYVSSPFLSTQGNFSINLSKAVPDRLGRFDGVVSANLDPSYFEIMARSVLYAPDMRVSLVHGNGKLFVDARHSVGLLGTDVGAHGSLFAQHVVSERDESTMQGVDANHGHRMVVFRTVLPSDLSMDTPLVVAVSRDLAAVYADWWNDVAIYGLLFGLLCAGTVTALFLTQQRKAVATRAYQEREALRASAAAELATAAELQRRTGKMAKVGGWQLDLATMRMDWTGEMFDIHETPQSVEPTLERLLGAYIPETRPTLETAIREAIANGTPWSVEACMVTPKGRELWVRTQGEAVTEDGRVVRLMGASQDVTERVQYAAQLAAANDKLRLLAVTDELTNVGNRRRFDQQLEAEWARCQRRGLPLGMLMLDVDHFKRYNDQYGHPGGDEVLRQVAAILTECAQRSGELVARYGGEEFAILLPGSDLAATRLVAQDVLAQLAAAAIPHGSSPTSAHVTVSIGVASVQPRLSARPNGLVQSADIALYAAKTRGRNRVEQTLDVVDSGFEQVIGS